MLTTIMDIMLLFCRWCRPCYHFVILTIKRKWSNHILGHVVCVFVQFSARIWPWPPVQPDHICPSKIIIHMGLNGVSEKTGKARANPVLSDLPGDESLSLCVVIYLKRINNSRGFDVIKCGSWNVARSDLRTAGVNICALSLVSHYRQRFNTCSTKW